MTNVAVFIVDDMPVDFYRFMPRVRGHSGLDFDVARTNVALCGAFRSCFYTGQLAMVHGNYGNAVPPPGIDEDNLIGAWLADAGYRTGHFGKYFNYLEPTDGTPAGWDTWRQALDYNTRGFSIYDGTDTIEPAGTQTGYLAEQLATFAAGAEPWFAVCTFTQPHYPFQADTPTDMLRHCYMTPPTIVDDVTGEPEWITDQPALTLEHKQLFYATARAQACELTGLDRAIGDLIATLDLTDTVVLFTSDNGMHYGDHRIPGIGIVKNDLYDSVLRVPLKGIGPGFTQGHSNALAFADVDVTATILAITEADAGLPDQAGVDLRGPVERTSIFHQRHGGGDLNPNPADGSGISTATRKLMRWDGQDDPNQYQMYDLDTDPTELVNVAYDPDRYIERDELEAELGEWLGEDT